MQTDECTDSAIDGYNMYCFTLRQECDTQREKAEALSDGSASAWIAWGYAFGPMFGQVMGGIDLACWHTHFSLGKKDGLEQLRTFTV